MFASLPDASRAALIIVEFGLATWLFSPWFPRSAALASVVVLSTFAGAITLELRKDHPQPCGCLGAAYAESHDPTTIRHALEVGASLDVFLIGLSAWVVLAKASGTPSENLAQDAVSPA